MIDPTSKPYTTNAEYFHRSAIAPVGIVAVVSMNTIWKRNSAKMAASYEDPVRKNPLAPKRPKRVAKETDRYFVVQTRIAPHRADGA